MFIQEQPSEDGRYKQEGLSGFMSTKRPGMPWCNWQRGTDSTCYHLRFLQIYGIKEKYSEKFKSTSDVLEAKVLVVAQGPDRANVQPVEPTEHMMGPKLSWCNDLQRCFEQVMRQAGWDGSQATSGQFEGEIANHTFSLARCDRPTPMGQAGHFVVDIVTDDVPF